MQPTYRILLFSYFLAVLVHGVSGSCPLSQQQIPKIQTGCLSLYSSGSTSSYSYTPKLPKYVGQISITDAQESNTFCHKFEQEFNSIPKVAISIKQIRHPFSNSIYFKINTASITRTSIDFSVDQKQHNQCKKIQISFLATDRQDFEIGVASLLKPPVSDDHCFTVAYNIKSDLQIDEANVRYFLSGLSLEGAPKSNNGIKHIDTSIRSTKIVLKYQITEQSKLQFLSISILAFSLPSSSILISSSTMVQSSLSSVYKSNIISSGIESARTQMVGVTQFEISRRQSLQFSLQISDQFQVTINPLNQTEFQSIGVAYFIIEVGQCGNCEGLPYLYKGECRKKCPAGFKNNKGKCSRKQQCEDGFILNSNDQCERACSQNQQYINNECVCKENYNQVGGKCKKCAQSEYYNKTYKTCEPLCSENTYYKNGRCYCNSGYNLIGNNRCEKCPPGTTYNKTALKCEGKCEKYEEYIDDSCICITGYERINGECKKCGDFEYYDEEQKRYRCKSGYERISGKCLKKCENGEIRVDGVCQCPEGEYKIDGTCTDCGKYGYYSKGRCKCDQGYAFVNGKCKLDCPEGTYFKKGKCIKLCQSDYERYDTNSQECQCIGGYERIEGQCVKTCGVYEYREGKECKCIDGYAKKYSNTCEKSNCPSGTVWNQTYNTCVAKCANTEVYRNGKCCCPEGYYRNHLLNTCQRNCSSYQQVRNGACECIYGYVRNIYGYCTFERSGPKTCLPGMVLMFGQCRAHRQCGQFQEWCGTQCNCIAGYFRKYGSCTPVQQTLLCPQNSQSNGVNCLCMDGYFPIIEGVCQKCPYGTYWNGNFCNSNTHQQCVDNLYWDSHRKNCYSQHNTCDENEDWNGIKCVCKQGRFFINGKCKQCQPGTVFDGIKCSVGYSMGKCKDPYSIWNGKSCVCLPGYWPLVGGKCVDCPEGTSWDGTCCKENQKDQKDDGKRRHRYPRIVY